MTSGGGVRRAFGRMIAALAVLAAAAGAARAVLTAADVWDRAHGLRHETYREARIRLFGAAWAAEFDAIRERVPEDATVYFVDFQPVERPEAEYFALHELAPRRVVRFGTHRRLSMRWLTRHIPPDAEWVALIQSVDEAPVVEPYGEFRARGSLAP